MMDVTFQKVGKSRYKTTLPRGSDLFVFKDAYTGLWRAREDGSPIDWAGPYLTLKEVKEQVKKSA